MACGPGFFMDADVSTDNTEPNQCQDCATCTYSWDSPSEQSALCDAEALDCIAPPAEGYSREFLQMKEGWWRAASHESNKDSSGPGYGSVFFRTCLNELACPKARGNYTGDARCAEGHVGPRCANCLWKPEKNQKWAMGTDLLCTECSPEAEEQAATALAVIGAGGLVLAVVSVFLGQKNSCTPEYQGALRRIELGHAHGLQ
jgi:hypothetical protein